MEQTNRQIRYSIIEDHSKDVKGEWPFFPSSLSLSLTLVSLFLSPATFKSSSLLLSLRIPNERAACHLL